MSRIRILARAVACPLVILLMAGLLGLETKQAQAAPARSYTAQRGPNPSPYVVLSYDDCPRSAASFRSVVRSAKRMGIALALFPTGQCIRSGRFNVAYARRHGHYVFNHSVSHANLTRLSTGAIKRQLSAPGVVTNYGRPPYGAVNSRVRAAYRAKGMRIWLWNVDTNDWRGKSRSSVVRYVVRNTRRGQTVLMHMQWNGFNGTALSQIKSGLARKGIKVCRNRLKVTPVKLKGSLVC